MALFANVSSSSTTSPPPFHSISYLHRSPPSTPLRLGCPVLDAALPGAVRADGVTEICGESASGKTQLCLQLCLAAQEKLDPTDDCAAPTAVYVSTEGSFPSARLEQLARRSPTTSSAPSSTWTDNVLVDHAADFDQLLDAVTEKIPSLCRRRSVRLVVVDSVAAIFRAYERDEAGDRWRHLSRLGHALHELTALRPELCVVCVNQVTSIPGKRDDDGEELFSPALGLAWSNFVTTRLRVSRLRRRTVTLVDEDRKWEATMRRIVVDRCPFLPSGVGCDVVIDGTGLRGVPGLKNQFRSSV